MTRMRGSVVPAVVAMIGLLTLVGAACAVAGALVVDHRRAQSAADLAALAGASAHQRGEDACGHARATAVANGARLLACDVQALSVLVKVRVRGPRWLGQHADLEALARAGSDDPALR